MATWKSVTDNLLTLDLKHCTIEILRFKGQWFWSSIGKIQISQQPLMNLVYSADLKREAIKQFKAYLDDIIKET
jgi:hypothetical protein